MCVVRNLVNMNLSGKNDKNRGVGMEKLIRIAALIIYSLCILMIRILFGREAFGLSILLIVAIAALRVCLHRE